MKKSSIFLKNQIEHKYKEWCEFNDVEHIPTQDGKCVGIKGTIWSTNKVNSKFDILIFCGS
jgi:hypothetical protein